MRKELKRVIKKIIKKKGEKENKTMKTFINLLEPEFYI